VPPGVTSFMTDFAGDEGDGYIEATVVTTTPTGPGFGEEDTTATGRDVPSGAARTTALDHAPPAVRPKSMGQPAALSAKIHAPAVSELRKPRASRRTPPAGAPVHQHRVHAPGATPPPPPMPAPRPAPPPLPPPVPAAVAPGTPHDLPHDLPHPLPHNPPGPFSAFPFATPASYTTDASGLPLGIQTPPGVAAFSQSTPQPASDPLPYAHYPPLQAPPLQAPPFQGFPPAQPAGPYGMPVGYAPTPGPHGYPQLSPGALYQFQPASQNMSITGQMRLFEADELPAAYKLGATRQRWFTYIASGTAAVAIAALATFLVIRTTRDTSPMVGAVYVESVPSNADVRFDGTLLSQKTPLTIDRVPVGARHTIRVELAHYEAHEEAVEIKSRGSEVAVQARLVAIVGKIIVETTPPNAEIWINGELRGRSPSTIDVDRESAKTLELRLKDYQPFRKELSPLMWTSDGKLRITTKLSR
jgi:hypothetical protein